MRILTLSEDTKKDILTNLLKRSPNSYGEYEGRVAAIIDDIKARRDEAVFEYTKKFDGYDLNAENILVTDEEGRMTTIFQRSDIFKLDILDIDMFEQPLYSIPALVSFE